MKSTTYTYAPSLCLKEAIYHHLLLFRRRFHSKIKNHNYNTILIKVQLKYIATVSASETHSKRPVCIKVSERYYNIIVFALRQAYM